MNILVRRLCYLLILVVYFVQSSASVQALTRKDLQDILNQHANYSADAKLPPSCVTKPSGSGSATPGAESTNIPPDAKLFVIGDSLTYGMTRLGGLLDKLKAAGYNVDTNKTVLSASARVYGRSVEATGGINTQRTVPILSADHSDDLKQSQAVIVALGTNLETEFPSKISVLINAIRTLHGSNTIPIYWVNTYFTSDGKTSYKTVNADILKAKEANGFNIIDLAADTEAGLVLAPDTVDGVHFTGTGYGTRAQYLTDKIKAITADPLGNSPTTVGTTCCTAANPTTDSLTWTKEQNQAYIFNFFVGKGYTPAQAAGIVGNMMTEARGAMPRVLQGVLSDKNEQTAFENGRIKRVTPNDDGMVSSEDVVLERNTGQGFGLVQFTPVSNLIANAFNAGIPYATIDTVEFQTKFIWEQMAGSGLGWDLLKQPGVDTKLKATTTEVEAAISFGRWYERFLGSADLSHPSYTERANNATDVMRRFANGAPTTTSTVSCPGGVDGDAAQYLPDCTLNGGNAAIACTAINELMGIRYPDTKATPKEFSSSPVSTTPTLLDCSGLTNMAIYRTFGTNPSLCSAQYRTNTELFKEINVQDILPGDLVGIGTECTSDGGTGHIAIVVSYDKGNKKLVTVETGSRKYLSGLRGTGKPETYNVGLVADGNGKYEWAVRYIGPKGAPTTL